MAVAQLDFNGHVMAVHAEPYVDADSLALILDGGIASMLLQPLRDAVHPQLMGDGAAAMA